MKHTKHTETSLQDEFLKAARTWAADVIKHRDEATAGVPDVSITTATMTLWLELKLERPGKSFKSLFKPRQLLRCRRLGVGGRCWFVVWSLRRNSTEVYSPRVAQAIVNGEDDRPVIHPVWCSGDMLNALTASGKFAVQTINIQVPLILAHLCNIGQLGRKP